MVRRWIVSAACLLCAMVLTPAAPAERPAAPITPILERAIGPGAIDHSEMRLVDAVRAWDARLGLLRDEGDLDALDRLDPGLSSAVARLLVVLLAAHDLRQEVFATVPDEQILAGAVALDERVDLARLRVASVGVARAVDDALPLLQAYAGRLPTPSIPAASPPLIDLAPVLVLDPVGVDTEYRKDAVLALDVGGADLYDMNAGGSIVGLIPTADPTTCQADVMGLVAVGCEFHDAVVSITASLALDLNGDDHYGVRRPAQFQDAACTSASIIRRIVMQGAGSGGVGMLVDVAGNDVYDAKTLSQGHGHIGGVGVLMDLGGNDAYTAIRSSQGSGVLGGVGVFADLGGNDVHTFAAPPGGIFNVDAGRCDATARLGLGAAAVASAAFFYEHEGDDVYRIAPLGLGEATLGHATFVDAAGTDDYGGYPGRGNGVRLVSSSGQGLFVDTQLG